MAGIKMPKSKTVPVRATIRTTTRKTKSGWSIKGGPVSPYVRSKPTKRY